jgi:hypothetical protein
MRNNSNAAIASVDVTVIPPAVEPARSVRTLTAVVSRDRDRFADAGSMFVSNPASDASPPSGPTGPSVRVTVNW